MRQKLILIILLLISGLQFGCAQRQAVDKTYYTQVNIWSEEPKEILSTNYHRGRIIPAGTKVIIRKYNFAEIKFTPVGKNIIYNFVHAKKHSTLSVNDLFSRHFSNQDLDLSKFSRMEKENIKNGTIELGMSKPAVIVAYGYPPSHQTNSLDLDQWVYWESRFNKIIVYFEDGKVASIDG